MSSYLSPILPFSLEYLLQTFTVLNLTMFYSTDEPTIALALNGCLCLCYRFHLCISQGL